MTVFSKNEDKGKKTKGVLYTELLEEGNLGKIPSTFFPSLFQEALDKEMELRIFYLKEKCYSMAIFSQLDEQTNVDFRMYNYEKGNRNVPYVIPKKLELKILKLMELLRLESGSLDFIKTKEGRFVFLEVNPSGQFGMTSTPCNYYLEEKITQYLCD